MEGVPLGAELVELIALRLAGGLVVDVRVERMSVEHHLRRTVIALERAQLGCGEAVGGPRGAVRGHRRPHLGAAAIAVGLIALVLLELVERASLGVDQNRPEVRAVGDGDRRWAAACRGRGGAPLIVGPAVCSARAGGARAAG